MVFVRAKNVGGKTYYQLVENYRPEGSNTPRQRVLLHLGRYDTVEAALKGWPLEIRRLRRDAAKLRAGYENWPRKDGSVSDDADMPGYVRSRLRTACSMEHRADALETHLMRLKELVRERRK
jgi:hypothetical protein